MTAVQLAWAEKGEGVALFQGGNMGLGFREYRFFGMVRLGMILKRSGWGGWVLAETARSKRWSSLDVSSKLLQGKR